MLKSKQAGNRRPDLIFCSGMVAIREFQKLEPITDHRHQLGASALHEVSREYVELRKLPAEGLVEEHQKHDRRGRQKLAWECLRHCRRLLGLCWALWGFATCHIVLQTAT